MDSIKLLVLEELLRKDPQSRVFLRLAEELRKSGQYERAIAVCKEGLPYHQDYVPALVSLGRSNQALGNDEDAERVFSRVLELAPDNTHALRGLGNLLADKGRYTEALGYLETLILHEPSDDEVSLKIDELKNYLQADSETDAQDSSPLTPSEEENPGDELFGYDDYSSSEEVDQANDDQALNVVVFDPDFASEVDVVFDREEPVEELTPAQAGEVEVEFSHEHASGELTAFQSDFSELPPADNQEDDSLANLDVAFEKAIDETDPDSDLFQNENAAGIEEEDKKSEPSAYQQGSLDVSAVEALITAGLKHEKMEHLEKARAVYSKVLEISPDDDMVKEHLERVMQLLASETPAERKIRVLSNWLDKIKGVYDVP